MFELLDVASNRQFGFLVSKLSWLDGCNNKEVVRWSGTRASGHYAQGVINRLVDEESVRTATPNKCLVLSRKVDVLGSGVK